MAQTSVEWLVEELSSKHIGFEMYVNANKETIKQAKKKHKEETIIAIENGIIEGMKRTNNGYYGNWVESENYYNETYQSK